ncbi:hypothetical protein FKM82_009464 [Ascaphus truei]
MFSLQVVGVMTIWQTHIGLLPAPQLYMYNIQHCPGLPCCKCTVLDTAPDLLLQMHIYYFCYCRCTILVTDPRPLCAYYKPDPTL